MTEGVVGRHVEGFGERRLAPLHVADDGELGESGEHEEDAVEHPDVESLDVADSRLVLQDVAELQRHREEGADAERGARRDLPRIHPETDPRHTNRHQSRDVRLQDEETVAPLESKMHLKLVPVSVWIILNRFV